MTVSAERPRLILPGLLPADPWLERYRVHPGAVTAFEARFPERKCRAIAGPP